MAHSLFLIICITGTFWFFRRAQVDPLAMGFASALVYFLPGIAGWTSLPVNADVFSEPISAPTYYVMSVVVVSIVLISFVVPSTGRRSVSLPFDAHLPTALLAISATGFIVSTSTINNYYFCQKAVMLTRIDGWYYVAAYGLPLCLVASVATRQVAIFIPASMLLLGDLFVGFRASVAMSLIAIALVFGQGALQERRRLVQLAAMLTVGAATLLLFPQLAYSIKATAAGLCPIGTSLNTPSPAQLDAVLAPLYTTPTYLKAIFESEPFVIQTVLNTVVNTAFYTGPEYLFDQLVTAIPGAATLFGLSGPPISFNSLFQPVLFPNVPYGMANTPWAQAMAAGGFGLLAVFAIANAFILWGLSFAFNATSGALRGMVAVLAAWYAFYFHRNDLLAEIGIVKQVLYTSVGACIVAAVTWQLARILDRRRKQNLRAQASDGHH